MIQALVITLREGIEAALVIGIILAYLKKANETKLNRYVYIGLFLAIGASIVGAIAFGALSVNSEAFEGAVMLVAAVFVASLLVWMWRTAKNIKGKIESRVQSITKSATESEASAKFSRRALGLLSFTFIMVFREGVETVLFLSAISFAGGAILSLFGATLGLALAVTFGVFFVKGSLKINLKRFFSITSAILAILVVQLALSGLHEFFEMGLMPFSQNITQKWMAIIGPIVRNDTLFLIAILALPLIMILLSPRKKVVTEEYNTNAEKRKAIAASKKDLIWRLAMGVSALLIILFLTSSFVYSRPKGGPPPVVVSATDGQVRIPLADVEDGNLHQFTFNQNGEDVKFLLIKTGEGQIGSAFNACQVCGTYGYYQDGDNVICKNCMAKIYIPTIGKSGGCNPISLESRIIGQDVVIKTADLNMP